MIARLADFATWRTGSVDRGGVDLGYHYDPVDYLIAPAAGPLQVSTAAAAIVAEPGITVVFSHAVSSPLTNGIEAKTSGTIIFEGTGSQPIRFTSTLACGDKIGGSGCPAIPGATPLYGGLTIQNTGSGRIKYCTFENADCALSVKRPILPIEGCRFFGCAYGVALEMFSGTTVTIKNCLFRNIVEAGIYTNHTYPLAILNSTFYRCFVGVYFGGNGAAYHSIHNCIFSENPHGMWMSLPSSMGQREGYNCFHLNSNNANFDLDTTTDVFQDPKFANPNSPPPDLYARFYLDQDYSPCVDKGSGLPFMSTASDGWLDVGQVDIGYHYSEDAGYRRPISWTGEINDISNPLTEGATFGHPWQLRDGSVLCVYSNWVWHNDATSTNTGYIQCRIGLMRSVDYGKTWQEPSCVTEVAAQNDWDLWRNYGTEEDPIWSNDSDRTVIVCDPYLIELSNGDLLCSFREHTYDWVSYPPPDDSRWEWTDFKIRIRRHPAGSTDWSYWQEWCELQNDFPTTWTGDKWSWTVWDSTLLELLPDPACPNDIKAICFFSRQGAKVAYEQTSGTWPGLNDYLWNRMPYGAARIITMNKQTGTRTDIWPTTASAPIIVSCSPDPFPWVVGWPGPNVTYHDPFPERQTGMCNAVALYDKILAVFEDNSDVTGRLRISRVTSADASGRVWNRPHPDPVYGSAYDKVYDPAVYDQSAGGPNLARLTDGRFVCAFMTDEDSTETPGLWPEYQYPLYSDIKAVVSDDWGASWSSSSLLVITQSPQRFASWSGLGRLRDDSLLCIFSDGPWGDVSYETVKCTPSKLLDELPIADHFDHHNLDGTPFMWGLLGDWQTTTDASHGKVVKGTQGAFGEATAFRGETSWTHYSVQAEVKIESPTALAGLYLRVNRITGWPGDYAGYQCYLYLEGEEAAFGLRVRYYNSMYSWVWYPLHQVSLSGFDSSIWHTVAVLANGSQFDCYLDGGHKFTVSNTLYPNGMIGLRVSAGGASFDNVNVLAVP